MGAQIFSSFDFLQWTIYTNQGDTISQQTFHKLDAFLQSDKFLSRLQGEVQPSAEAMQQAPSNVPEVVLIFLTNSSTWDPELIHVYVYHDVYSS